MRLPVRPTLLLVLCLVAPAAAQDPPTGGAPAGGSGPATKSRVVVVTDGSFTVSAREDAMMGRRARVRGSVPRSEAGRTLAVQRLDARKGWVQVATTTVDGNGDFLARWRADRSGRISLRAVLLGTGARAAASSPQLGLTVYRPATSTWYGPGFYGRRTACGQRMSRTLLGVAHRRLPCGTKVALLYRGRTLTVPVVDRGPFRRGTRWDLTAATAEALGFRYTDRVGAMRIRATAAR